ncbi:helix-turn-helix domain-containing protein [Maliponia aquimaris]|nr:helix-turn-helix transcriptional regulator [Maliponia aquimaris]
MRFSVNLRRLVQGRGSVTDFAKRLDISRAQFNRYLSGESHPKPAVLKRICDHFGVDARILTEVLPDTHFAALPEPGSAKAPSPRNYGLENAVTYLPVSDTHHVPEKDMPDGLYLFWRPSMARRDRFVCNAVRLATVPGARVFRTYLLREARLMTDRLTPAEREMRGLLLGVQDGVAWLFLHSPAWNNVSLVFSGRPTHRFSPYMHGFYALARNEVPGQRRLARCIMERLPAEPASIIRAAHATGHYRLTELPEAVRDEVSRDLD